MTVSNILELANVAETLRIDTNRWPSVSCPWLEMTSLLTPPSPKSVPIRAEITLLDERLILTQLAELSLRGCHLGTLEPIPIGTEFGLRISDGIRTCELQGKVIRLHSSNGLWTFSMDVLFGEMAAEQRSVIDTWLHELTGEPAASPSAILGP